jgi:hypothetical protein
MYKSLALNYKPAVNENIQHVITVLVKQHLLLSRLCEISEGVTGAASQTQSTDCFIPHNDELSYTFNDRKRKGAMMTMEAMANGGRCGGMYYAPVTQV